MRLLNDQSVAIIVYKLCRKYIQQIPTSGISLIEYNPKVHIFIEIIIFSKYIRRLCIFFLPMLIKIYNMRVILANYQVGLLFSF